jgi:hypothetical protein
LIDQDIRKFKRLFLLALYRISRIDRQQSVIAYAAASIELRLVYAIGISAITTILFTNTPPV